jgi:hypothetical protein
MEKSIYSIYGMCTVRCPIRVEHGYDILPGMSTIDHHFYTKRTTYGFS